MDERLWWRCLWAQTWRDVGAFLQPPVPIASQLPPSVGAGAAHDPAAGASASSTSGNVQLANWPSAFSTPTARALLWRSRASSRAASTRATCSSCRRPAPLCVAWNASSPVRTTTTHTPAPLRSSFFSLAFIPCNVTSVLILSVQYIVLCTRIDVLLFSRQYEYMYCTCTVQTQIVLVFSSSGSESVLCAIASFGARECGRVRGWLRLGRSRRREQQFARCTAATAGRADRGREQTLASGGQRRGRRGDQGAHHWGRGAAQAESELAAQPISQTASRPILVVIVVVIYDTMYTLFRRVMLIWLMIFMRRAKLLIPLHVYLPTRVCFVRPWKFIFSKIDLILNNIQEIFLTTYCS